MNETAPSYGDRYKFTGREWDAAIDLQYSRARWYDPSTRNFISPDPAQADPLGNTYRYVGNDPMDGTDPSGMATDETAIRQSLAEKDPEVAKFVKKNLVFVPRTRSLSWFQDEFYFERRDDRNVGTYWRFVFDSNSSTDDAVSFLIKDVRKGSFRDGFKSQMPGYTPPEAQMYPTPDTYWGDRYAAELEQEEFRRAVDNGANPLMLLAQKAFAPGGHFEMSLSMVAPSAMAAEVSAARTAARADQIASRRWDNYVTNSKAMRPAAQGDALVVGARSNNPNLRAATAEEIRLMRENPAALNAPESVFEGADAWELRNASITARLQEHLQQAVKQAKAGRKNNLYKLMVTILA